MSNLHARLWAHSILAALVLPDLPHVLRCTGWAGKTCVMFCIPLKCSAEHYACLPCSSRAAQNITHVFYLLIPCSAEHYACHLCSSRAAQNITHVRPAHPVQRRTLRMSSLLIPCKILQSCCNILNMLIKT